MDEKTILPESDLYSLGMTMIYALSGDEESLKSKEVPANTPEPMKKFKVIVAITQQITTILKLVKE